MECKVLKFDVYLGDGEAVWQENMANLCRFFCAS